MCVLNLNQRDRDFYEETKDKAKIYLACAMCQVNLISFKPYRHTHTQKSCEFRDKGTFEDCVINLS